MEGDGTAGSGRLAIVADDLTGAADAAAPFAAAGIGAAVALCHGVDPGTPVVAVSTESRDLPELEAVAAVRVAAAWLSAEIRPGWWYKKVDSMWRGHPEAESVALAEAVGIDRAMLSPELPTRGRAVRDGVVFVDEDVVARPLPVDRLGRLALADVRLGPVALAGAIRGLPAGAVVADGETEEDLRALAEASLLAGGVLLGGSAGLAVHLAGVLPLRRRGASAPAAAWPVLAVVASRHSAAIAQVAAVEASGVARVVRAPTDPSLVDEAARSRLAADVSAALASGPVVLTTVGGAPSPLAGRDLARGLAAVAAHPDVVRRAAAFYLSGGDAAAACLSALGARSVVLGGEVEPGIPWGAIGDGIAAGSPVVTKAGSFGDRDTLARCLAFLVGGQLRQA